MAEARRKFDSSGCLGNSSSAASDVETMSKPMAPPMISPENVRNAAAVADEIVVVAVASSAVAPREDSATA